MTWTGDLLKELELNQREIFEDTGAPGVKKKTVKGTTGFGSFSYFSGKILPFAKVFGILGILDPLPGAAGAFFLPGVI